MKKKLLAGLMLVLATMLCACGSDAPVNDNNKEETNTETEANENEEKENEEENEEIEEPTELTVRYEYEPSLASLLNNSQFIDEDFFNVRTEAQLAAKFGDYASMDDIGSYISYYYEQDDLVYNVIVWQVDECTTKSTNEFHVYLSDNTKNTEQGVRELWRIAEEQNKAIITSEALHSIFSNEDIEEHSVYAPRYSYLELLEAFGTDGLIYDMEGDGIGVVWYCPEENLILTFSVGNDDAESRLSYSYPITKE